MKSQFIERSLEKGARRAFTLILDLICVFTDAHFESLLEENISYPDVYLNFPEFLYANVSTMT
jgi:hypothetical protein